MAEYIALYKKNNKQALEQVFINMTGYVNLLRKHISKESNILFRMADRALSEEDHKTLLDRCASVTPATVNGGGIPEYLSYIEKLEEKYK
jgi:hemerythrin-like domain-containing protein